MRETDVLHTIRKNCVFLARSDAGGSARDWMRDALVDVADWALVLHEIKAEDERKNRHK